MITERIFTRSKTGELDPTPLIALSDGVFAIHRTRMQWIDGQWTFDELAVGYTVTHIETGKALITAIPLRRARALVHSLRSLHLNWNDVNTWKDYPLVRRIVKAFEEDPDVTFFDKHRLYLTSL